MGPSHLIRSPWKPVSPCHRSYSKGGRCNRGGHRGAAVDMLRKPFWREERISCKTWSRMASVALGWKTVWHLFKKLSMSLILALSPILFSSSFSVSTLVTLVQESCSFYFLSHLHISGSTAVSLTGSGLWNPMTWKPVSSGDILPVPVLEILLCFVCRHFCLQLHSALQKRWDNFVLFFA